MRRLHDENLWEWFEQSWLDNNEELPKEGEEYDEAFESWLGDQEYQGNIMAGEDYYYQL